MAPAALMVLVASCASAGEGTSDARPAADGPSADSPPIDAPPVDMCPSAATCADATMLGSISGDTENQKLTAMGHQSAWFRVRVTEDYNHIIYGRTLRTAAKLTSPPGVDFDVFVYVNLGSDAIECSASIGAKTTNGNVEQTRTEWGEMNGPNGSDDDRWMSIEVRPVFGACAPDAMWQLEIEGNWN
jgi:hypothetical protein